MTQHAAVPHAMPRGLAYRVRRHFVPGDSHAIGPAACVEGAALMRS